MEALREALATRARPCSFTEALREVNCEVHGALCEVELVPGEVPCEVQGEVPCEVLCEQTSKNRREQGRI